MWSNADFSILWDGGFSTLFDGGFSFFVTGVFSTLIDGVFSFFDDDCFSVFSAGAFSVFDASGFASFYAGGISAFSTSADSNKGSTAGYSIFFYFGVYHIGGSSGRYWDGDFSMTAAGVFCFLCEARFSCFGSCGFSG